MAATFGSEQSWSWRYIRRRDVFDGLLGIAVGGLKWGLTFARNSVVFELQDILGSSLEF